MNEPTPASARIATGGPPTPFFSTMLMTPPIALSPYSTAPLLPRVISMRSIESRGMVEKSTPCMSMSLTLRPLISTRVLEVANAPKPRRSTLVFAPLTPPNRLVSCTPGVCAMISCTVSAGECAISCAVMTEVAVPTMPLNCRTAPTPVESESAAGPGAGTALGSAPRRCARHDAARGRGPGRCWVWPGCGSGRRAR